MQFDTIERYMGWLRYFSIIAVVSSSLGSLLMYVLGAVKVFKAYTTFMDNGPAVLEAENESHSLAIGYLVQGLDSFLIALVLMIFAGGIYNLFIHRHQSDTPEISSWTRVRSIGELKGILAELVVIILMVKFLETALAEETHHWEMLMLPIGVLLIAIAIKVLGFKDN